MSRFNQGGYGQSNPYDQDTSYGNNRYNGGGAAYQPDVEMQPLTGTYEDAPRADPNSILNECQAISVELNEIQKRQRELNGSQRQFMNNGVDNQRQIDSEAGAIFDDYRGLVNRVRVLKGKRDAGSPRNAPQIGRVDRELKRAMNDFQRSENDFGKEMRERTAREVRIVQPDATEEEVQQIVESGQTQIFQQSLMQGQRREQASTTMRAVQDRHQEIQRIEQTMVELAQLFQDLERIVVEQEPLVENIEKQAEEVQDNMVKGNVEMGHAVNSARAARKKKWICLGITVLIIIIIICAVLGYLASTCKLGNCTK